MGNRKIGQSSTHTSPDRPTISYFLGGCSIVWVSLIKTHQPGVRPDEAGAADRAHSHPPTMQNHLSSLLY